MKITVQRAIELINQHEVVALPTETVYGLAARIDSEDAIRKIFALKQRPLDHPLIMHIADPAQVYQYTVDQPEYLPALVKSFWPGPLTIILKKHPQVSDLITANQDSVAIRMPQHPITQDIIRQVGVPLVAPSANRFCQTSPTCANHVELSLGENTPVVDGGPCTAGIESTIIDARANDQIFILRPGIITATQITNAINIPCTFIDKTNVKFSGSHQKHYAPNKPIYPVDDLAHIKNFPRAYIMALTDIQPADEQQVISMPNNPKEYAALMYRCWYEAANLAVDCIVIELPPQTEPWQGVRDRISKAASKVS